MNLSPNFSLAELTRSSTAERLGLDNTPSKRDIEALFDTAAMLENIRAALKAPIIVTSGYRSAAVNKAVGGVTSSDHLLGMAADIISPKFGTPYDMAVAIEPLMRDLGVGTMILEGIKGKRWLHVSTAVPVKAVNRVLTITDAGTKAGIHPIA